jgi:cell division protein FtsW (lipid II flippase)
MAVTRSTAAERTRTEGFAPAGVSGTSHRGPELAWLLLVSAVLAIGLGLVYAAKTRAPSASPAQPPFNLRSVDRQEQLLPYFDIYASPADRQFAAKKIFEFLSDQGGRLPNIGALARVRMTQREVLANRKLDSFRQRFDALENGVPSKDRNLEATLPLLTAAQIGHLKRQLIVREMKQFTTAFAIWTALFFAAFYAVHFLWRIRGFAGEWGILPLLHLLTGIGLILMISLRDPLRDTLTFASFAQGVAAGCVLLAVASLLDFESMAGGLSFVPLLLSILLSIALILFGTGPGTSDAKVNLGGFQPVEAIKILLVFFLAGYFAKRWEFLRELREKRPELAHISRWIEIPRLEYVMPVVVSIALVLLFFFLQKDLGPALVFSCVFLVLYAVARNRVALAAAGIFILMCGFAGGYVIGHPQTVHDRVQMWLSPWDNAVHGGDQVVQSLWAMATGGIFGSGIGLGEPGMIPAGYTDLILSVLGEEWGYFGILIIFLCYAALLFLSLRITRRAPTDYTFFLGLGLTLLIALQILLISAGILDLVPLSGVVTPFLSYGRTAMLANFAIFAILLSISARAKNDQQTEPFHPALKNIQIGLAALGLIVLLKAGYVQIARADAITGAGTLVVQADKVRRFQYNPRLMEIAREIPRGAIYDRNGLPLATSNWDELQQFRDRYAAMGIKIDEVCNKSDARQYPLGSAGFHLLGDLRTRANWSAQNSSLQERDSAVQLQGYDDRARVVEVNDDRTGKPTYTVRYDYRELLPLLRHRHEPNNAQVKHILNRNRDVKMSIDARLQIKAAEILRAHLRAARLDKGALVVLDPETGDLLASVSEPSPSLTEETVTTEANAGKLLDRARYGLYPPGSTFKVVTAMAALRTNPELANQTYQCIRLPDGRVGNYIGNSKRPIRDDVQDKTPHGTLNMEKAITVSCNAYFAQLAAYKIGPEPLLQTASLLGISVANPATAAKLKQFLPQAGYGQGQVVASPFQMARVAATVASGGNMRFGRWVIDESNARLQPPTAVLPPNLADALARDMRLVVTNGTGKRVSGAATPIAGKTGTAELSDAPSHAWFIGFTPYGPRTKDSRRIAFAILVENGQYGGAMAAPMAIELVEAAQRFHLLEKQERE